VEIVKKLELKNIVTGDITNYGMTSEIASPNYIEFDNKQGSVYYASLGDTNPGTPTILGGSRFVVEPELESEEFKLLTFSLGGSNNSGGTVIMSDFLFRNSEYIRCTRFVITSASKYEKSCSINEVTYAGTGVSHVIEGEWELLDGYTLVVPSSADYWHADFYGYVINPPMLGAGIEQTTRVV